MKTVIALIAFSDGELSMFKGEIRDIDETKAEQLVSDGYVAEYSGGSGGGVLVVTETEGTLDKTWQECFDAEFVVMVKFIGETEKNYNYIRSVDVYDGVYTVQADGENIYTTDSASGYPSTQDPK